MTKGPQNLVKGQHAPNTHLWLVPSHSDMGSSASKASSLAWEASTCCCAMTSCSMNSWITASLTGPCKHCLATVMIFSSSSPHPSISSKSRQDASWTRWRFWVTSMTFPCMAWTCCWVVHYSWDIFIHLTTDKCFNYDCTDVACFFSS